MTSSTGADGQSLGHAERATRRVVLTDHPWPDLDLEREILGRAGLELVAGPESAPPTSDVDALVREADPVAIMTCWAQVSEAAISAPTDLAIVARLGVGLDNIAVAAATERGAWVSNVPDYCTGEVSDHAIALMLAHYRGVVRLDAEAKASGWNPNGAGLERIADLTVGIIGYGRIGRETARKLSAFGCRVLTNTRSVRSNDDWSEPTDLSRIKAEADVIILHAPLTAETLNLVDRAFLTECERRPLLINVSRGGLVDNDALRHALDSGWLRGAALDVIEGEPAPPAELIRRADVIVTPHIAFASAASLVELRRRACEEVVRAVQGEALRHPCNDVQVGVPLEGGVASDIRVIDGPNGKFVVKRALAKLRVAADWFSDPARSATEVAAIDAFTDLLGTGSVPEILWTRPDDNLFAMRLVDPRLRNWKQDLLAGRVDRTTAARAGGLLGEVHCKAASRTDLAERFRDQTYFHELRVAPFFLRVADKLPEQSSAILAVVDEMAVRRTTLVHGDYSPKNILADGSDIVVLDFEVTHWGDPMFDTGFCVSHLFLKGLRQQASGRDFAGLIREFLKAYRDGGALVDEPHFVKLTGCLILARLKGSSPVDYLSDIDEARTLGIATAMVSGLGSLDHFLTSALEQA